MRAISVVGAWLAALAIGLGAGPAGAAPMLVLEPIPWTSAGVMGWRGLPAVALSVQDHNYVETELLLPPASMVELHQNGVDFEADLVSTVVGERWEFGFENIQLSMGPDVVRFHIGVWFAAKFEVPFDGIHPTSAVAFREEGDPFQTVTATSSSVDFVDHFVSGDTVTMFRWRPWTATEYDESATECNFTEVPGVDLRDCTGSVEIFLPTVVDGLRHPGPVAEPAFVTLGAAAAAVALGARRRRRYAR